MEKKRFNRISRPMKPSAHLLETEKALNQAAEKNRKRCNKLNDTDRERLMQRAMQLAYATPTKATHTRRR